MGSMPVHSIMKGSSKGLSCPGEPILLHRIFEHTVEQLEKMKNSNNNIDEKCESIHSIIINDRVSQDTALIYNRKRTSFAKMNEIANQLARAMLTTVKNDCLNADGDFIVAVCLNPSDVLVTTLLACWKMGAAYVPIDPTFPANRVDHIMSESRPALVVISKKDKDVIQGSNVIEIEYLQELAQTMDRGNLCKSEMKAPNVPESQMLAIVLYTSGSTGVPKGVRLPHAVVLNRLKWQWDTFPYSETEKMGLFKTTLTFVDSVSEIWGPLLSCRSLVVIPKEDTKDAERIMSYLEEYEVERFLLVPTLLQSILLYVNLYNKKDTPNNLLKRIRLWVCSGEPLPPALSTEFYKCFDVKKHLLCNFYGSTEIMGDVTYFVIENPQEVALEGRVPIGKPVHNTFIYLLNENLSPVNMGEVGEIYVSGYNLASGYVKNRDAHRFIDNNVLVDSGHRKLYRTGDYGRIIKNQLYYEGRTDSQVKVRGNRVDLSEIEAAIKKSGLTKQVYVLAFNPGQLDQAVVAFVVPDDQISGVDVEDHLKSSLPSYMVPEVKTVESMPLLVNGKVDRQSLLRKYREEREKISDVAIDYTGIDPALLSKAKAVFETVAEVLGNALRSKIKAESNFFGLGGNSLNAVYFVTKLRDVGYNISIRDFLACGNLLEVARTVQYRDESVQITDKVIMKELENKYRVEVLEDRHRKDATEIIASSFYAKADLESFLEPKVPYEDYVEVIDQLWDVLVRGKLSFVVRDSDNRCVGTAFNVDPFGEELELNLRPENRLACILEFLDQIEHRVMEKHLPQGKGKIIHSFMMGSRTDLSIEKTIETFIYMEEEIMRLARSNRFEGVFTTNTSPLTQQLGKVNNYTVLEEYQANKYITSEGIRLFEKGPDSLKVHVSWKAIGNK